MNRLHKIADWHYLKKLRQGKIKQKRSNPCNILHFSKSYHEFTVWVISRLIDAICSSVWIREQRRGINDAWIPIYRIGLRHNTPHLSQSWSLYLEGAYNLSHHFNKDEIGEGSRNINAMSTLERPDLSIAA